MYARPTGARNLHRWIWNVLGKGPVDVQRSAAVAG